jgi:hypothetical protein
MNRLAEVYGPSAEGTFDLVINGRRRLGLSPHETAARLGAATLPNMPLDCDYFSADGKPQEMPPSLAAAFKARGSKAKRQPARRGSHHRSLTALLTSRRCPFGSGDRVTVFSAGLRFEQLPDRTAQPARDPLECAKRDVLRAVLQPGERGAAHAQPSGERLLTVTSPARPQVCSQGLRQGH